jgi:hypothetical protein
MRTCVTYENLSETTEISSLEGPEIPDPIFIKFSDFNEELAPVPLGSNTGLRGE